MSGCKRCNYCFFKTECTPSMKLFQLENNYNDYSCFVGIGDFFDDEINSDGWKEMSYNRYKDSLWEYKEDNSN
jgi:hypothetical protein